MRAQITCKDLQRGSKAELVEGRGAHRIADVAQLVDNAGAQCDSALLRWQYRNAAGQHPLQLLRGLQRLVVQVRGDAPSLLFLRMEQPLI